ncbi:MAG: Gfo/Idh/MocA family oxidoreductase [Candidatus Latescibacterota bacterium]|nr:Gfo/Idh/MocA family oxidoreductase [Candidatus Latescibacterota bacterium]
MKRLNIAVIGGGNIAQQHLHVLKDLPEIETLTLVDTDEETLQRTGDHFEIDRRLRSVDDLLNMDKLDAAFVLVSVLAVHEVATRFLSARIPTFLEKPPGLHTWQTRELANLARERATLAMVGVNRRFYSTCIAAREAALEAGPIQTVTVEAHEDIERVRNGTKFSSEVLNRWSAANGIHALDMIRFFGGDVSNVTAVRHTVENEMPDACGALIEFEKGGLGRASMDWIGPGGHRFEIRSGGMTLTSSSGYGTITVAERGKEPRLIEYDEIDRQYKPGFHRQDSTFLRCVQTGEPLPFPACDLDDAVKTMQLIDDISGTQ